MDGGKDFDFHGLGPGPRPGVAQCSRTAPGTTAIFTSRAIGIQNIRDTEEVIYLSNSGDWVQWCMMQNSLMSPIGDHWGALPTPEPSAVVLFATGLIGLLCYAWRKRK